MKITIAEMQLADGTSVKYARVLKRYGRQWVGQSFGLTWLIQEQIY